VKFLVIWRLELALLSRGVLEAVLKMPDYAGPLEKKGKIFGRYHVVGSHGGAWLYDVESNEELDRLLAMSTVYNYARYEVLPLAEMKPPVPPG
jgi:muconolactone delta-isomerase